MAITITYKSSVYSTSAGAQTASPTWTPAADSLLVACVVTSYASAPADPTAVNGHGIAYSKLTLGTSTLPATSSTHILSIWVAKAGSSPTSAAAATTVSGTTTGSAIIEFEVTGADVSGTAANAIQASTATNIGTTGTAHTVTLASASSAINRALTFCVQLSNAAHTAAGSWTLTTGATGNYNTPATGAVALFRNDAFDTAGAATGASVGWRMVGIEIKGVLVAEDFTAAPGAIDLTGDDATETLGDVTWTELDDTLGPTANSYSDTTASADTTYLYRVVAVNGSGETPSNREEVTTPPGAVDEQFTASPGSLATAGVAATLALALTASSGTYAVTGTLASVVAAAPITALPVTYAVTGRLASAVLASPLTASPATYSATGFAATLVSPTGDLSADRATYTLTGAPASFTEPQRLTASPGTYTIAGTLASVVAAAPLTATRGTVTVVGVASTSALLVPAIRGTLTVTGVTASAVAAVPITAIAGGVTVTGKLATLAGGGTQLVVELRQGATLIATRTFSPESLATDVAVLTLGERAAVTDWTALRFAFIATGDTTDVTWAALRAPANTISANQGLYTIAAPEATLARGTIFTANAGAYAVSGVAITTPLAPALIGDAGSLTVTGAAVLSALDAPLLALSGAYTTTGAAMVDVHAGAPTQATFVLAASASTASGTTISITIGAPAVAGDVAFVTVGHRGGTTGTISALSPGWTAADAQQNSSTVLATRIFSKTLTAPDLGVAQSFAFNTAASVKGTIVAVVLRGNNLSVLGLAQQTNSSNTTIAIPGLTVAPQGMLLVAIGHKAHDVAHSAISGWTLPTGATVASTGGTATNRDRLTAQYRVFQGQNPSGVLMPAGASGAVSTGHQLAVMAGATLTLSPALIAIDGAEVVLAVEALVPALVGSVAATGVLAATGIRTPVSSSPYTTTGVAATFTQDVVLIAAPGTYTTTGAHATLETLGVFAVTAEPGTVTTTGALAGLSGVFPFIALGAQYTSTGKLSMSALALAHTAGAYTSTGTLATFSTGSTVAALRGIYTVTGALLRHPLSARHDPGTVAVGTPDAGLRAATFINATRGTVTMSGRDATVEFVGSFGMPADRGVFTVTGGAAGVAYAQFFSAAPGSSAVDGVTNRLVLAAPMLAGAITVSGVTATTTAPSLVASVGSVAVTGTLAMLRSAQFVSLTPPASYLLAGVSSTEQVTRAPVLALKGTYTTTGIAATFIRDYSLIASAVAYTLTGKLANETVRHDLPALTGSYTLTGTLAQLAAPGSFTINAERATVTVSGSAATLFGTFNALSATAGAVTLTGASATVQATGLTLAAIRGTVAATGTTAMLDADTSLIGTSGSTTLTGAAATLLTHSVLVATRGTFAIVGHLAGVSGDLDLSAIPGVYAVTAVPMTMGPVLSATSGALVVTGAAAGLAVAQDFTAAPGSYILTGADASLIDITTPVLDIGRTEVVALTPNRTVVSLTPSRSVVELPTLVETE